MAGCPRFLGRLGIDGSPSSTDGIGMIDDTTFVTLDYNSESGAARLALYTVPSHTATPFLEPHTLYETAAENPGVFIGGQIGVRDNGNVFYFDQDTRELYRQNGATYAVIGGPYPFTSGQGLAWNPYDDQLYDFYADGSFDFYLRRIDPDSGVASTIAGPFPGDGIESDHPTFTPDGGIWFYADVHPCRYDIEADTFEIFTDLDPHDVSGCPVPAWGTPGAAAGDVFSEIGSGEIPDEAVRISAAGDTSAVTCPPFVPEDGNESARIGSTGGIDDYRTIFLWPTSGGGGADVWLIDGRSRARWWAGVAGSG